jgi:hypothetical protein
LSTMTLPATLLSRKPVICKIVESFIARSPS